MGVLHIYQRAPAVLFVRGGPDPRPAASWRRLVADPTTAVPERAGNSCPRTCRAIVARDSWRATRASAPKSGRAVGASGEPPCPDGEGPATNGVAARALFAGDEGAIDVPVCGPPGWPRAQRPRPPRARADCFPSFAVACWLECPNERAPALSPREQLTFARPSRRSRPDSATSPISAPPVERLTGSLHRASPARPLSTAGLHSRSRNVAQSADPPTSPPSDARLEQHRPHSPPLH